MLSFISSQFLLYVSMILVLFVPGYFLLLTVDKKTDFSALEKFVLSFGGSITLMNFFTIAIGKAGFSINRVSILGTIAVFCLVCYLIFFFFQKKRIPKKETATPTEKKYSQKSIALVLLIIFLSIFIKTIYFQNTVFPTSTDLGHHMYWTKGIITSGQLPVYEKADISFENKIEQPTPIADFIIGEHLIFAAIGILSGASVISAFPMLVLFLIHIMTLLAFYVLAKSLFKKSPRCETIAITTLLLLGPLYSLASPQAKFVSGGVIGNTVGNLFIALLILLFARALSEKKSSLLSLALFLGLGLAYTHHLSTFVFVFISLFALLSFGILNFKTLPSELKKWSRLIFSPWVFTVLALGIVFVFFLYTPTYLNTAAIDTAVGSPIKTTRTGLTLSQLQSTAGEARLAFAIIGLFLLTVSSFLGKYKQAFLIGWLVSLTIMSLRPSWLFIDIPSNRIASYVVFPTAIIGAFMLVSFFGLIKTEEKNKRYLNPLFSTVAFFGFLVFVFMGGFYDNSQSLNPESSSADALSTYAASKYLATKTTANDIILKDHNYLPGDSWIKLFFMRGYNYPLSRGYFKRYQDETKTREQCTNLMISMPSSPEAEKCFAGTSTDFIMLNPNMDKPQFAKLTNFWQVYSDDSVAIFYKHK